MESMRRDNQPCAFPDRAFRSVFRQELEYGGGECCRITTGAIIVDILKNDLLSPRHTLGDRLADSPSGVL
jgi:hypothetical protein